MDNRENLKLIKCVEKLGDKASGCCANLYIDEYDEANYDYYIDEYDGKESIKLIPVVSEKRLTECKNTREIVEYLRSIKIKVKST